MKEIEEEENNNNYNYTTNYAFKLSNINNNNENNDNNDNNDVNTDSSKNKAVMKCNQEFLTFDKKNYPLILRDIIQKWEWENIAVEANLVIGNAYHLRKLEENVEIPKYMNVIFWILFFFTLIDLIFLIPCTQYEGAIDIIIYSFLGLTLISSGIIIGFMFYNYSRELQDEKKIDTFIIEGMDTYMSKLNKKYLNIATFKYNHDKLEIECILKNKDK
jgi:hypothetical protein